MTRVQLLFQGCARYLLTLQDQWRAQVKKLLEDDQLRSKLASQALDFAKDYSVEQFATDVRTIYATTLALFSKKRKRSGSSQE